MRSFDPRPRIVHASSTYHPRSGNSMGEEKLCSAAVAPRDCTPGCTCPPRPPDDDPNVPSTCYEGRPPSQLKQVLEDHLAWAPLTNTYNEVVVDTASVVAGLPHTISAFFYRVSSGEEQREEVRKAHAAFLAAYDLGDGGTVRAPVPLLELDLEGGSDHPLKLVRPMRG